MTISEIREKILVDDAFVLEETRKIQYLYGLKREVRYALKREEQICTESVAEHVYGMQILATYFLPLEDNEKKLDWQKIYEMITYHDIDEVETGDMIGYLKTDAIRAAEADAAVRVIENSPEVIKANIEETLKEYGALQSLEAKFVKAIDRIEPLFELYNENGRKIIEQNNTTRAQNEGLKYPYVSAYPFMKRFCEIVTETMDEEGYYAA